MPPLGSWTPERIEKLRELWATGITAAEIAVALGPPLLSRNSVISKANRIKLPPRVALHFNTRPPKPKRIPQVKAKRVTLPPLPINRPDIIADGGPGRPGAWLALEGTTPIPLHMLGDAPREGHVNTCRWPIGENPTLFCGCATEKTYCPAHFKMAYRPLPEKAKK